MSSFHITRRLLLLALSYSGGMYCQDEVTDAMKPRLDCQIIAGNKGSEGTDDIPEVTSLQRISVRCELVNAGVRSKLVPLEALSIEVSAVDGTAIAILPVKFTFSGGGGTPERRHVWALLLLPIPEEQRRRNIKRYLSRMVEVQESMFEELRKKIYREHWSVAAADGTFERVFEARYVENRVGTFEMICRYQPMEVGGLEGEKSTSRPIRFRVRNDGTFIDTLIDQLESQKGTGADEMLRLFDEIDAYRDQGQEGKLRKSRAQKGAGMANRMSAWDQSCRLRA